MQESDNTEVAQTDNVTESTDNLENRLIVYYLHGDVRCATCQKLESYSKKALTDNYAEQLADGSIEFIVLNYDKPENEHFLTDFDISYQALVVIDVKDNAEVGFEKLAKIWDLTNDEDAYLAYVKEKIDLHVADVL